MMALFKDGLYRLRILQQIKKKKKKKKKTLLSFANSEFDICAEYNVCLLETNV